MTEEAAKKNPTAGKKRPARAKSKPAPSTTTGNIPLPGADLDSGRLNEIVVQCISCLKEMEQELAAIKKRWKASMGLIEAVEERAFQASINSQPELFQIEMTLNEEVRKILDTRKPV